MVPDSGRAQRMRVMVRKTKRTKQDRALELYENSASMPQDKLVRHFIAELDLPSANSARTYISLSKKALSKKLNISFKSRKIDSRKTKRGKAMELFNNNPGLCRKDMIALFIDRLEMTEGSAAVHCSQCSQEYSGPKHNAIV